ncbi:MAG: hypothetical protein M3443_11420, partial [Actinomycetota bacterium]|nr:hypothetical protein [Actinomycetota bacterium]
MAGPSVQARALARFMLTSVRPFADRLPMRGTNLRVVREAFDALGFTPLPRGSKVRAVSEAHGYGDVSGLWI